MKGSKCEERICCACCKALILFPLTEWEVRPTSPDHCYTGRCRSSRRRPHSPASGAAPQRSPGPEGTDATAATHSPATAGTRGTPAGDEHGSRLSWHSAAEMDALPGNGNIQFKYHHVWILEQTTELTIHKCSIQVYRPSWLIHTVQINLPAPTLFQAEPGSPPGCDSMGPWWAEPERWWSKWNLSPLRRAPIPNDHPFTKPIALC